MIVIPRILLLLPAAVVNDCNVFDLSSAAVHLTCGSAGIDLNWIFMVQHTDSCAVAVDVNVILLLSGGVEQ